VNPDCPYIWTSHFDGDWTNENETGFDTTGIEAPPKTWVEYNFNQDKQFWPVIKSNETCPTSNSWKSAGVMFQNWEQSSYSGYPMSDLTNNFSPDNFVIHKDKIFIPLGHGPFVVKSTSQPHSHFSLLTKCLTNRYNMT
jgi:hypothetical protein